MLPNDDQWFTHEEVWSEWNAMLARIEEICPICYYSFATVEGADSQISIRREFLHHLAHIEAVLFSNPWLDPVERHVGKHLVTFLAQQRTNGPRPLSTWQILKGRPGLDLLSMATELDSVTYVYEGRLN